MSLSAPSTPSTADLVKAKLLDLSDFLLRNQDTLPIATCQNIYKTLPTTHKSVLKQFVGTAKRNANSAAGRERRQQKLYEIQNVEPSKELQDRIKIWANNFESFFQDPECAITANHYSLSASFTRIDHNEETRQVATIRRRFDLRSFYVKVVALGYHSGTRWRQGGSDRLAKQLKRSLGSDGQDIQTKLEKYVELGSSWNLWASLLGGPGYLLILPQTVPEGLYERRQNRADIDSLVGEVRRLGIQDTAHRLHVLPLGSYISKKFETISPEETFSYSQNRNRKPSRPKRAQTRTPRASQQSKKPSPGLSKTATHGPPDTLSASVWELKRPQWGSSNTMAFSTAGPGDPPLTGFESPDLNMSHRGSPTAGPIFLGDTPLTGFEDPNLDMPLWGSSQTFSYDIPYEIPG